jgi:hypothetical protein
MVHYTNHSPNRASLPKDPNQKPLGEGFQSRPPRFGRRPDQYELPNHTDKVPNPDNRPEPDHGHRPVPPEEH